MPVQRQSLRDIPVLEVSDRFDRVHTPSIEATCYELLARGYPYVVVNVGAVSLIDGYGLGSLVRMLKRCHQAGGTLLLARVPPLLGCVLGIIGLDRVFAIHPDIDAAVAAIEYP